MPGEYRYYVYLLTNKHHTVLYTGVTNHLIRRIREHKQKQIKGFTHKYNISKLVYFEETEDISAALEREKQIKKWRREKKITLVNTVNPDWKDLGESLLVFSKWRI